MPSDPPIGGQATNLRCTVCGRTFYSHAAREMVARQERCPRCGGRLAAKRPTHIEDEGEETPPREVRRLTARPRASS